MESALAIETVADPLLESLHPVLLFHLSQTIFEPTLVPGISCSHRLALGGNDRTCVQCASQVMSGPIWARRLAQSE